MNPMATADTGAIVTDIEGTTSSLSFVKDVLFPYARAALSDFVARHGHEPAVRALLNDARAVAGASLSDTALAQEMQRWIDADRKLTPLKALQGLIWETGYRRGDFRGHVYADAVAKLQEWHVRGIPLYVYSSGSVHAQKLLFAHTEFGDLTPLFRGYFDTEIGPKRGADSYRCIAQSIGIAPARIAFLSDIAPELAAAQAVGMRTVYVTRAPAPDFSADQIVTDFSAITL